MSPFPDVTERSRALPAARSIPKDPRHTSADTVSVHRLGTRNGWAMRLAYLLSDLFAIGLSFLIAEAGAYVVMQFSPTDLSRVGWKLYILLATGLVVSAMVQRTYGAIPPRPARQFRGWVLGAVMTCVAIISAAWLFEIGTLVSYATLALATMLAILLASFYRAICRIALGSASWWGTRVIVIGSGGLAAKVFADLKREPQWGLRGVGFVDDAAASDDAILSAHYLGSLEQLEELTREHEVDWALVTASLFDAEDLAELLSHRGGIRHWIILPPLQHFPSLWLEECEAARMPALTVTNRLALPWSAALKRTMDLTLTITVGVVALPLIAAIALLVRLGSPGPIFYGSARIGRHGRRFYAWKFRTMLQDADLVLAKYLDQHPELAAEWKATTKLRHDPRVTWIGRWLRITSLDELPQLLNVLRGEMSLVGPRPILPCEAGKYGDCYEHYIKLLPGLTGLWQVSGRNNTTYSERVDLDTYYLQNWSLWLDFYILACTVKVVLLSEGAY